MQHSAIISTEIMVAIFHVPDSHRIIVQNFVIWHDRLGKSADGIATGYDLDFADIYAALAYYFDHREEIDQEPNTQNEIYRLTQTLQLSVKLY